MKLFQRFVFIISVLTVLLFKISGFSDAKIINLRDDESLNSFVVSSFEEIIQPLYGDQTKSLNKIFSKFDRETYVLLDESSAPIGILVAKTSEKDTLEIKTLFIVNSEKNSGKGFGSLLLKQALDLALELNKSNILVTVAEDKKDSLAFFQRKGFEIIDSQEGIYREGKIEYFLRKNMNH